MDSSASLTRRAMVGLAQMLIVMALALFVSAWSLHYWQGWTFLAVFSVAVTIITFYFLKHDPALIERRIKAGPVAEQKTTQKIIQALASLCFIALLVVPGLDYRFGWSRVPTFMVLAGDVLVVAGLYIVFLVFRENSFTSAIIEVGKDQTVIATGPYRFVRHPMYAGAILMLLGMPLALGSTWGLLFCVPIYAVIVWRLIDEESYLRTNLNGYADYCARTPYHLIPWIY